MAGFRIPQSASYRAVVKAFLASDHISAATGKTIAATISKNGAVFANPSAGATNLTEIGSGWYYLDLSATDTAAKGPLILRGTATGVDDVEIVYRVVDAHNADFDALPAAAANANGGLPILSAGGTTLGYTISTLTTYTGNIPQTGDSYALIGPAGAGLTALGDTRIAHLDADISSRTKPADTQAAVTNLTNLPAIPSGWLTAAGIAPLALDGKGDWLLAADYIAPPSPVAISNQVASDLATAHGAGSWATATGFSTLTTANIPTAAAIADKMLVRNLAGGTDGGRTVQDALRFMRNRWTRTGGVITVYQEDDTTPAWTINVTSDSNPT